MGHHLALVSCTSLRMLARGDFLRWKCNAVGGRALLCVRDPISFAEILFTKAPGLLNVQVGLPGSGSGTGVRCAFFFQ
ncbi:hypothetical protein SprV_0200895400 [Sparganum proliferum]